MASPLLAPALAEVVIITYRDAKNGSNVNNPIPHFPLPSQLTSVLIVYGGLSLLPQSFEKVAALMGWGFVVATLLDLWTPGGTVAQVNTGSTPTVLGTTTSSTAKANTTSSSTTKSSSLWQNIVLNVFPK